MLKIRDFTIALAAGTLAAGLTFAADSGTDPGSTGSSPTYTAPSTPIPPVNDQSTAPGSAGAGASGKSDAYNSGSGSTSGASTGSQDSGASSSSSKKHTKHHGKKADDGTTSPGAADSTQSAH